MAAFSISNWHRTVAIAALLMIWLVWGLSFINPDVKDDVLSKLPAFGSTGTGAAKDAGAVGSDGLRPLILYTYAESENARDNLKYFLHTGLHGKADFIFIFNGDTDAVDLIPSEPNISIIRRENKCFDIGAYGEVLQKDDLWKKYKRFIMMNASIRGPFAPTYYPQCWMDAFLGKITDTVKLVGTTLNCHPRIHLQSMLLATDDVGMAVLLDPELGLEASVDDFYGSHLDPVGFSACFETLHKAVHAEIGITQLFLSQGFDVDVVMTAPHSQPSFTRFCEEHGKPDDFLYHNRYLGTNVHPYETMFMKANREIDPTLLDRLTEWHMSANMTSWDTCGR